MSSEVRSREMNRGGTAFERRRGSQRLGPFRMPLDLEDIGIGMGPGRSPDQEDDLVFIANETLGKCPSHKAGSAAQQELPDHQDRCGQQFWVNKLAKTNQAATGFGCSGNLRPMVLQATRYRLFPIFRLFTAATTHLYCCGSS
jgi:hypothetical protein